MNPILALIELQSVHFLDYLGCDCGSSAMSPWLCNTNVTSDRAGLVARSPWSGVKLSDTSDTF